MPRPSDPALKAALIEIGARLLDEEGPQALSTRRIAAEAGSSTMPVYTYFGGMSGLVREMVYEGFARLHRYFAEVNETGDPVADMALMGRAYRHNAVANPHLYAVMFGGASLAGFELSDEDRQHGRYNLLNVVDCARRCIDSGRFRQADALLVAHQMWITMHGLVNLELGDYLIDPCNAKVMLETQLVSMMIGAGDRPELAAASVAASALRFSAEIVDPPTLTAPAGL
ncbi:TetR/AcrR family transcriptional regulator [Actinocrispum wychmicini]|uniref:TetR family transcriptional regulator n=1 Tax=Actinocrispum wychmicini TaxID=1213861 RepID=A0A4R2JDW3_9PSEU|nr:TetR/AcrR family transcriptional regulator [Actinocrispum wychmicini]TCO54399.1 TetR family transcriptional regulator [Actinocrispum wychmicini]